MVDASVAVKWVLTENHSDAARALTMRQEMSAPSFWLLESASVIWKRCLKGELSPSDADDTLGSLAAMPLRSDDAAGDFARALTLGTRLQHPVYDCLYLAVALRLDALLVTADGSFISAIDRDADLRGKARHVADYASI